MNRLLLSFFIMVALLIGNPSIAIAQDLPSAEAMEQLIEKSLAAPSQVLPPNFLRLSDDIGKTVDELGPLRNLPGTWVGRGWNLIAVPIAGNGPRNRVGCPPPSLPSPFYETGDGDFCVEIAPYVETITFTPIGAEVPNRGVTSEGKPNNTFVVGLHYQQVVSNAETFEPMHIENGMWLLIDKATGQVARLSSIPHGNSLLAIGNSRELNEFTQVPTTAGLPTLSNFNSEPIETKLYTAPYEDAENVPPFTPDNPNEILQRVIDQQNKVGQVGQTQVLIVSTAPEGGIVNIPFIEKHADASAFQSIFWVEDVKDQNENHFLQLQYSQTTDLAFKRDFTSNDPNKLIVWPHVDVATLVKQ